jgi:2-oxo-4-hydroxy-4-carboxy-5-ureidoimidazoline decarboxylase
MKIADLNNLSSEKAKEELFRCCGSTTWATELVGMRPFKTIADLQSSSDLVWSRCREADCREAFTHHPKIGDVKSLEEKFAATKKWAGGEQSGVNTADVTMLEALAAGNHAYEEKFGFIFIVCASGKSAREMLDLLNERIGNDPKEELKIAMNEQNKITHLRLQKLIE